MSKDEYGCAIMLWTGTLIFAVIALFKGCLKYLQTH